MKLFMATNDKDLSLKLKPEVKQVWLTALRSGDYKQGQGILRRMTDDGPKYCCLGVLCEVSKHGRFVTRTMAGGGDMEIFVLNGSLEESITVPHPCIWDWATADMTCSICATENVQSELIKMNDGSFEEESFETAHYTFAQIADWIEENL